MSAKQHSEEAVLKICDSDIRVSRVKEKVLTEATISYLSVGLGDGFEHQTVINRDRSPIGLYTFVFVLEMHAVCM